MRQDSEENHLSEDGYNTRRFAPVSPQKARQPTRQQLEDMRDDRSFGTESDYYGNASIRSSPAPTPAAIRSSKKSAQKKASNLRQETLLDVVEEAPLAVQQPPPPAPIQEALVEEPVTIAPGPEPAAPQRQAIRPEDTFSVRRPRKRSKENSTQPSQSPSQPPSRPQSQPQPQSQPEPQSRSRLRPQSRATTTQAEPLHTTIERDGATSHFRAAPRLPHFQSQPISSTILPNKSREQNHASNHSEADDAMQRDIAAASEPDETRTASPLKNAWMRVKDFSSPRAPSLPPWLSVDTRQEPGARSTQQLFGPSRVQPSKGQTTQRIPRTAPLVDEDEDVYPENNSINWWCLLHPRTYIDAIIRFMDVALDHIELGVRTVFGSFGSRKIWQGVLGLLMTIMVATLLVGNGSTLSEFLKSTSNSIPPIPRPGVTISELSKVGSKIGDFAGSIHFPIPSFRRHNDMPNIWELDESGRNDLEASLRNFDVAFKDLRSASGLHDASIEKLEKLLPQIIHVKSSNGKLAIGEDFYYAMRDMLRDDETVLTFDEKNGDYVVGSDKQWRSLVHGISNDPYLEKKLNLSMSSIESRLDGKMTSFWDSWIKDNDDKISARLGTALESLKAANSKAELDSIVKAIAKDQIRESSAEGGTLITRDDFIKQLKREFQVHRHEIRTELDDLQPQLKTLIQETVRLANTEHASPVGMSREDVTTLVNTLIRRAIVDTDLKAMAQGKIYAHWDADLKNQVNYFAVGGGAFADPKISSATYDPFNKGLASMDTYAKGLRGARPLPPVAALQRWDDEGDCWCAAREVNHRGNPHGATLSVLMGHQVIPQHIVIEHILPGATSDPGARPRDIEIHARIEDPKILSRVQDFSATHFAEKSDQWDNQPAELGRQFVKIGQFTYEGAELHDGVHVHRLSKELVEMGADTDQVVVRAISNYGAKEHTCFYRVRMYGEKVEVPV